jgi:hypothetical protein
MSRIVYITAQVKMIITVDEGIELDNVMSDLVVETGDNSSEVEDFEVETYEIDDSK